MPNLQWLTIIAALVAIVAVVGYLVAYNQLLVSPSSIPASSDGETKRLLIVTSIPPIENIIENVGGNKVDVLRIVPDREDSHTFALSVTDAVIIRTKADLIIINGLSLEDTIEQAALQATNPNLRLLKLADNTITREQWIFDNSFPEEQGRPNPHLWLNVKYTMKYVELIRDELSLADPLNAEYYDSSADAYLKQLRKLDEAIRQAVETIHEDNRKLITYHDSWPYFASEYGFKIITALQPANFSEPTDAEIAKITNQIRSERVSAIFASEDFPNDITQQIADIAGVEVVRTLRDDALPGDIDASHHTYIGMMVANVRTIVTALGGDASLLEELDPSNTYQ